jgi:hypothetical protein
LLFKRKERSIVNKERKRSAISKGAISKEKALLIRKEKSAVNKERKRSAISKSAISKKRKKRC